ncbi:hypothetical protein BGZ61DRAFT_495124 [Ilyonectria robusta]|uniref:uncharacterized protein n=1 Tax=Ilyonectria robusta TaxID=1079257 RepID=UPI001E8DEB86|nr:uncharacterized protein BGZ61DRAFT_495124 [Ilyonectria robusta]KAH8686448.1 hypothetical protein BGZ61DRAFT_495124 [Ilyonectria robusta]
MSGVEFILSAVLAVIPLAIEAYDHSERVFEVFSVFKQYPREVVKLDAKLGAQRTIFRNHAINLLMTITNDPQKVQDLMCQPSSEEAKRGLTLSTLYRNRVDSLKDSFMSCQQTLVQIKNSLNLLYTEAQAFHGDLNRNQGGGSTTTSTPTVAERLKQVRTRFKLSLNKPQIEKAIGELRDFNTDFCLITNHIINALQLLNTKSQQSIALPKSTKTINSLQRCHQIRTASLRLYSTLTMQWACSSHLGHIANLCLAHGEDDTPVNTRATQHVSFEIAISHEQDVPENQHPIWLKIEQYDEEPQPSISLDEKSKAAIEELTNLLESSTEPFSLKAPASNSKPRKSVRFDQIQQTQPTIQSIAPCTKNTLQTVSGPDKDLHLVEDFCHYFQHLQLSSTDRLYLGFLRDAHLQRFYSSPISVASCGSHSLADIIAWVAEEPVLRCIPRPCIIRLAGTLADGIMQFYSTPWLPKSGLGESVRFFEALAAPSAAIQLKSPHFMVKLERPSKGKERAVVPLGRNKAIEPSCAPFFGARNDLLFNFGILLLEIGFGRPWSVLKGNILKTIDGDEPSNYEIAEKLAQLLVRQMGLTYPRVIRKCLGCDFGLGETDLDNEELQRKFLEDVVGELQQLGAKLNGETSICI